MDENISREEKENILNILYDKILQGLPNTPSCYELADEYLNKYGDKNLAIEKLVNAQIAKCTTSGFLTSLGGLITLPVMLPANLTTVWYVQLRMIATIAIISGKDPSDDEVQTLAYVCLTGMSLVKLCREFGIQFANKLTLQILKKIPGKMITKINQKLSFRFITKFGTTGLINLGKMIPLAGGFVGGVVDYAETKAIANRAIKVFVNEIID